jgi:hypothetical protein
LPGTVPKALVLGWKVGVISSGAKRSREISGRAVTRMEIPSTPLRCAPAFAKATAGRQDDNEAKAERRMTDHRQLITDH